MATALPPSIHADYLVLRRAGWMAMARTMVAPASLVLGSTLLAWVAWYREAAWWLPVTAMFALGGSFALVRSRLGRILERSRFGWCGALPVRSWATFSTLLASTAAALAVAIASASLALVIAAIAAPHRGFPTLAMLAVDGGLAIGAAAAISTAFRKSVLARSRPPEGIREPLFALTWLDDARLPHLLDWQRRAALVQWRRGGSFVLVGCVLVAVPDGAVIPEVVALVLLALSLAWLAVVMRACAEATDDAVCLLGATPLSAGRARRASLRYPFLAASCALAAMAVGAILGGRAAIALGWAVCACAASAWPLVRILRATRVADSSA